MSKVPHNGTDTSRMAAEAVRSSAESMRVQVLRLVSDAGDYGLTCDEIQVATKMLPQTASARCNDLKQLRIIVDSGRRRPTRTGCKARVYVLHPRLRLHQNKKRSTAATVERELADDHPTLMKGSNQPCRG